MVFEEGACQEDWAGDGVGGVGEGASRRVCVERDEGVGVVFLWFDEQSHGMCGCMSRVAVAWI